MEESSFYKSLVEAFVVVGVSCLGDMRPLPPIEGNLVSYEPHLLDCIPESRRDDSMIRDISLFCLPEGVVISDHHGSPQGATFVLTDEVGTLWYGTCLRFYDSFTQEEIVEENNSNIINNNNTGSEFTTSIITETTDTIVNVIKGSQALREKKNKTFEDEIQSTDDEEDSSSLKKLNPLFVDFQKTNYIERTNSNTSIPMREGSESMIKRTRSEDMGISVEDISPAIKVIEQVPEPKPAKSEGFYCSKCLCILSKLPYYEFFHEYLTQVYTAVFKDNSQDGNYKSSNIPPIETYISNLVLEIPVPPPGIDVCLRVFGPIKPLILSKPPTNELPPIQVSIRTLFLCLDKANILLLLTAILLERQILFISKNNNLLTIAAECLYNLTYPFFWKYVYIPVLPPNLIQCTEAPTPYIMGVDSKYLSWIDSSLPLVIVDLDNNTVNISGDTLPNLPSVEKCRLMTEISIHIHPELSDIGRVYPYGKPIRSFEEMEREEDFHKRQIRLSFVEFFVSLFSGYKNFLIHGNEGITFDNEEFLKTKSEDSQAFLKPFLETNIFYSFLQEAPNHSYGLFHELLKRFEDKVSLSELRNGFEYYSPHLDVVIPMNNPREYKFKGEPHRAFSFPRFKKERGIEAPRFQLLLKKIDLIINNHPSLPQLHLLKAQILSQLSSMDAYYLMQAITECIETLKLNEDLISKGEIQFLLSICQEDDLQTISMNCTVNKLKSVALELYKSKIEEKNKIKEKQKQIAMNESKQEQPAPSQASNISEYEEEDLLETKDIQKILTILHTSFISEEGVNRNFFLKLLKGSKILSDDNSLSKMNKYFKSVEVKNLIPVPVAKSIVSCIVKVYEDILHYQHIFNSLLGFREIPVFFGPVSTFSGKSGKLLLTSTRLILFKKKRNPRYHSLKDIQSIEVYNYVIVFPPGVPCIKILIPPKTKPYIYVFWNFSLRDLWATYILEIIAAYKINELLFDNRILNYSIQNILFSEALQKRDKRRSSKAALTYFGKFYPNLGWFKIQQSLEATGMLNVSHEGENIFEGEINDAMGIIISMLDNIARLFFEFVEGDGSNVNFTELKRSIMWSGFLQLAASLQQVDVSKLASKEKTLFFINLYNIMVIHAYVICGGFPKSILDWRYIEKCAYYSLGGVAYSLGDVHHGILRGNTKSPWDSDIPFPESDHRKDQLHNIIFDNRVLFLLSTHLEFSPSMFKLNLECLEASFRVASEFYCQEHVLVDGNTISLPITLYWYKDDFGGTVHSVLKWAQSYLTATKKKKLQQLLESAVYEVEWVEKWVPCPKPLLTGGMKVSPNCDNYSFGNNL